MTVPIFPIKSWKICGHRRGSSFFPRSFRAISVWVRRQAMAGRFFSMTSNLKGPKATSGSQRRSFMAQRKALGRGLSALLGTPDLETPEAFREIDIDRILPNSHQPRKNFD